MSGKSKGRRFGKRCCCECGVELPPQPARYDVDGRQEALQRLYCERCKPIGTIKQTWQPLGSGVVSRIFVVEPPRKKNTVL
ncbi:MAG: hypothetical protein KDD69_00795 [Bdellovibrionales bacterium]|nr:hypothetical protein [Bdellovibrionales bacterium]